MQISRNCQAQLRTICNLGRDCIIEYKSPQETTMTDQPDEIESMLRGLGHTGMITAGLPHWLSPSLSQAMLILLLRCGG